MYAVNRSAPADVVSTLLAAKASSNAMSAQGDVTVLRMAIERCDVSVLEKLVATADVSTFDVNGGFPLLYAVCLGSDSPDAVKLLLGAKASVDAAYHGRTPAYFAAAFGHSHTLRVLLEHRADPVAVDMDNVSMLMMACMGGDVGCVEAILEAKASADAKQNQTAPLMIAANWGRSAVCSLLLAAKSLAGCESGESPLLGAILEGQTDAVLILLRATPPPRVDITDENGRSLLCVTLEHPTPPDPEVVRHLCSLKADVGDGPSALVRCVRRGMPEVARVVIEAKADINAEEEPGISLLRGAISRGAVDMVRALCEMKADVHEGEQENPILCVVASKQYTECIRRSRMSGHFQGKKPDRHGSRRPAPQHECVLAAGTDEFSQMVAVLAQHGAAINRTDSCGNSPLSLAVERGFGEIVCALVQCPGIEIDAMNSMRKEFYHSTALLIACSEGYSAIATELLRARADVNQKEPVALYSPLIIACQACDENMVEILLAHHADPTQTDIQDYTAFDYAQCQVNIERLLRTPPAQIRDSQKSPLRRRLRSFFGRLFSGKRKSDRSVTYVRGP